MSYDASLATNLDKARALIGDTSNDSDTELLTDDHIEAVLALESTFEAAVAFLADELIARFAQDPVSVSVDGLSVSYGERIKAWSALASRMRITTYTGFTVKPARNDGYTAYAAENE